LLGVFQVVVCGGAIVERPDLIDGGAEASLSNEFEDGAQFVFGAHVGAQDGQLAGEQETDIELGVVAGGGAASDEPSAGGEAFQAVIPSGSADMLDNNVDAAIVGKAANFLGDGHDEVVDDFVGAEFPGFGKFFVVPGGGDDACAEELGDLDGSAPNTASSSENEDGFTGLELSTVDEHMPGSDEHERNGGGVCPIEFFRIGEAIDLRDANIFRTTAVDHVAEIGEVAAAVIAAGEAGGAFAASDAGSENDFLADMNSGDFGADLGYFTGDVAAGNVRERDGDTGETAANPKVEVIKGTGMDADEDFIVAESRFGNIGVAKDGRVTMLLDDDGLHAKPPWNEGVSAFPYISYNDMLDGAWRVSLGYFRST